MVTPDLQSPPLEASRPEPSAGGSLLLAAVGTLAGAALGAMAFAWLLKYGLHAIMLPGVLAGLGGGYPLKRRFFGIGIFAAVVSLVGMILAEWWNRPFAKDESLLFFLAHVHHLPTAALLLMFLGVAAAFWFGMGREKS